MTLPFRYRPESLQGRASSQPEPIAAECDELLDRMNRLLKSASRRGPSPWRGTSRRTGRCCPLA